MLASNKPTTTDLEPDRRVQAAVKQFQDAAYEPLAKELERVEGAAWQAYAQLALPLT